MLISSHAQVIHLTYILFAHIMYLFMCSILIIVFISFLMQSVMFDSFLLHSQNMSLAFD